MPDSTRSTYLNNRLEDRSGDIDGIQNFQPILPTCSFESRELCTADRVQQSSLFEPLIRGNRLIFLLNQPGDQVFSLTVQFDISSNGRDERSGLEDPRLARLCMRCSVSAAGAEDCRGHEGQVSLEVSSAFCLGRRGRVRVIRQDSSSDVGGVPGFPRDGNAICTDSFELSLRLLVGGDDGIVPVHDLLRGGNSNGEQLSRRCEIVFPLNDLISRAVAPDQGRSGAVIAGDGNRSSLRQVDGGVSFRRLDALFYLDLFTDSSETLSFVRSSQHLLSALVLWAS